MVEFFSSDKIFQRSPNVTDQSITYEPLDFSEQLENHKFNSTPFKDEKVRLSRLPKATDVAAASGQESEKLFLPSNSSFRILNRGDNENTLRLFPNLMSSVLQK